MFSFAAQITTRNLFTPIAQAVSDYITTPITNFIYNKTLELGLKTITSVATKKTANLAGIDTLQESDQNANPKIEELEELFDYSKKLMIGMTVSRVIDTSLTIAKYICPQKASKYEMLQQTFPRASFISITKSESPRLAKEIVTQTTMHFLGSVAQRNTDAILPIFAPLGGYAAYGVTSAVTDIGLNKVYDFCKKRI